LLHASQPIRSTGLNKIISIKASLNKGLSSLLIEDFPVLSYIIRESMKDQNKKSPKIFDPDGIIGFISGEGGAFM
jgi:hypothetical protein